MKAFQSNVLLMAMGLAPLAVQASGFALIEQSASAQGLSYAGAAAFAEDASIMWFNPAGLTKIENNQLIAAGHVIAPSAEFSNDGSYILSEENLIVGADDDGAQTSFVPNFYWKTQYKDIDVGLGINVPFGSTVEYDQNWVGRYHAVYTSTKTVNINPAFAVKLHPQVSFGAGLNIQYIDVNLTQKVDLGDQENDGYVDLQADGIGYGFNFGFLYDLDNGANIGLSYRSQIKHNASGDADFTAMPFADQGIESTVTLPASASLSVAYPFNDKINILADATWTGWSSFDELRIEFDNKEDSVQPEEWNDIMRYSLGATYQYAPDLILRTGVAYDQTPIPSADLRTPRIPDSDRIWLSFGAGYQWNKTMRIDVAYSHLWGGTEGIEAVSSDTGAHVLQGRFDTKVDILSAQLVWNY